jgi:hypothetical protein
MIDIIEESMELNEYLEEYRRGITRSLSPFINNEFDYLYGSRFLLNQKRFLMYTETTLQDAKEDEMGALNLMDLFDRD